MGENSGQVYEVFDDPRQLGPPWNRPGANHRGMTVLCNISPLYSVGTTIVVGNNNVTLGQYLWSGRNGHYYEVPGGWPGWEGEIAAKEFYIWYDPDDVMREIKYLSKVSDDAHVIGIHSS